MAAHTPAGLPLGAFEPVGATWLNTAHQGVLAAAAAAATIEAVGWKQRPYELTQARFDEVPARLRQGLARLVNADTDDIVLANSASYGLHLVANAYPWSAGDEVLVMEGDFPSDILPWLLMERRSGIVVRRIRPADSVIGPAELEAAISPRTRLLCVTWVHSFSGHATDLAALGALCRDRGVLLVANVSQALGARGLDLATTPVDAITCAGFKWLCGPYGSGFCWMRPELRARLTPQKAYWLAQSSARDLQSTGAAVALRVPSSGRAWDVFGTANFMVFPALTAAIEHLLDIGLERIASHDQALVARLIGGLDLARYRVTSPIDPGHPRSTLVLVEPTDGDPAAIHERLRDAGIHVALRAGRIRISPHLYNGDSDIDDLLTVMND